MDIRVIFKLPSEYGHSGLGKELFNQCLRKFKGIDHRQSEFYYSCEGTEEIFVLDFLYKNCFVHKLLLENEQLKQLENLQNYILKIQGFEKIHSVGRKNKLSKTDIDIILNSSDSYRALASKFNCSLGLIAKVKKKGGV